MPQGPPPGDWLDRSFAAQAEHGNAFFDGTTCVPNVGTGDASCGGDATDNEELTMFVPFINRTVCLTINELANVDNPGGEPPELDDCAWATKFTGSFAEGVALTGGTADALSGHSAGCVRVTASCAGMGDSHHYFQVLVAR